MPLAAPPRHSAHKSVKFCTRFYDQETSRLKNSAATLGACQSGIIVGREIAVVTARELVLAIWWDETQISAFHSLGETNPHLTSGPS